MTATRGYIRGLCWSVVIATLGCFLINLTVDPWRVTPTPFRSTALEPYRDVSSQDRTAKCGMIRSAQSIGVALLGSSRVANSLDPLDPRWTRNDVYNLGCSAGYFYESEAFFRFLLEYHDPDLVILGLDPGDLSSTFDSRGVGDSRSSPIGPPKDRIEREIRYRVGISTLEASVETLKRAIRKQFPQYDPRGLRRNPPERPFTQRHFLAESIRGDEQFRMQDPGRIDLPLLPEKRELLRGVLETSRQRGIRLVLLIHPQHALLHARSDLPPLLPFERERREIVELASSVNSVHPDGLPIEVWDFGDYHALNCDPIPDDDGRMAHWNDFNHYTLEMGGLMLARILDWPIALEGGFDYGMNLRPANFDDWVSRSKKGYRAYLEGPGQRDVTWKDQITRSVHDD